MNRNNNRRKKPFCGHPQNPGFTLIELLCAIGVMMLVFAILFQISGNILKVSNVSRQEMDANQRTRAVLDSIEADLKNLVTISGSSVLVLTDGSNNTQLTFLTNNRGPSGSISRYLAVSYRLDASGHLMRSYYPFPLVTPWTETNPLLTAATTAGSDTASISGSSNGVTSSVVADSVLRFEAVVVLDDGTVSPVVNSTASWLGNTVGSTQLRALMVTGTAIPPTPLVRAITVGVAALDSQSYRLPRATGITTKLPAASSANSDTLTPYGQWSQAITGGALNVDTVPKPAAAALRISQNTFRLK